MLSFRHILQRWPRQARFFVLALALLQFVAPTWHVCEMGGHVMAGGDMSSHAGMAVAATAAPTGPQRPLICYCAAKPSHHTDSDAPHFSPTLNSQHATCLALLLQSMPGHFTAGPALFTFSVAFVKLSAARPELSPSTAFLSHFRGRAPPLTV